jgi:Lrp/AsnC family transcriptional regulator, regulator for asnA, asnC and gidA
MAVQLDKKDKQILYELDRNARQPLSKIAKRVQLKRESVLYRLRKYLKEGVIRDYLTVVDLSKLGFTHYKIYLRLHNVSANEEKELIKTLCNNPFVSWVSSCDGSYSLIFGVKARSMQELDMILNKINSKFWKMIKERQITTIIKAHHYYRDYLIGSRGTTERKIEWGGVGQNIEIDEKDIEILDSLCENSRINAVEISNMLHISSDSVIQRIRKLQESNVLTHYMIWPNVNKLKGIYYKVLVRLHNLNEANEKKLYQYCLNNPNIVYLVHCLGDWQLEIDLEAENTEEFRSLMKDFLNNFSEIISDYTALNIYEEYKFRFFEKEILKDSN